MTTFAPERIVVSSIFEANLAAIARRSPRAAQRLAAAAPRHDIAFADTEQNALTAEVGGTALASRRRPLDEAHKLAQSFDLHKAGALVVLGFGLGHHLAAIAQRMQRAGVIVIFEPDVGLLRAVLERIDHSQWMSQHPFVLLTDPDDAGAITESLTGYEPQVALGVEILQHPASRARLGESAARFNDSLARVISAIRTHVITTMMQTDVTVRNILMNVDHYLSAPGVGELAGIAPGRPAVVVSAGPSLRRTIDALAQPGVRDRCIIVAVQTVLRQLLDRGIRPHFVTALDYHEISRRFYEGLTADNVRGITLIAEPKANPAILEAWPGDVRLIGEPWADDTLGPGLTPAHTRLKPGATVAHLACYVARHLGCDPLILTGQDLAFTDGQYYAKGAAIHRVWSGELNPFNTLEMMEWQRIVRMRGNLHRAADHLGRPVYTDDQMATYLAQFERDFMADRAAGLTIIDATEGGIAKANTVAMPLAEALDRFASQHASPLPPIPAAPRRRDETRIAAARERFAALRRDTRSIARASREADELLRKMLRVEGDNARLNRLIHQVHELRDQVQTLDPAFGLVQRLNQAGAFKRYKADRDLMLAEALTPHDRQRRQIERDAMNVRWLAEVADTLDDLLDATCKALAREAPKRTRDAQPATDDDTSSVRATTTTVRTGAVIPIDLDHSPLGLPRDLARPFRGRPIFRRTLERLAQCRRIDTVLLLTDQPGRVRALMGDPIPGLRVEVVHTGYTPMGARRRSIAAARLWASSSWRAGLGGTTCYDEILDPCALEEAMQVHALDAALILGPDWCLVDPALCDAAIERHAENPRANPLAFTQAPPGLAGCVVGRQLVSDLAVGQRKNVTFATVGGALGYIPTSPRHDPIAKPCCLTIDAPLRDTLARFIPDSALDHRQLEAALAPLGDGLTTAPAARIAEMVRAHADAAPAPAPRHLILELTPERAARGERESWAGQSHAPARAQISVELAERIIRETVQMTGPGLTLTLAGAGDPLCHAGWRTIIDRARDAGVSGIHVRTDLLVERAVADELLASSVDVISVDLLAARAPTYERLIGIDAFQRSVETVEHLARSRRFDAGLPTTWVVPRITRCDAVYEEIEPFFDAWLIIAGAAVIDQLPVEQPGERIAPLGKPDAAARRDARERLMILSDGSAVADERGTADAIGNAERDGIAATWARIAGMPERWTGW